MYRRRTSSSRTLMTLILLGMVGGIAFLIFDGLRTSSTPIPTTPIATIEQPTSTPQVIVQQPTASITATPTPAPKTVSLVIPSLAVNAPIIDVYLVDGIWDVSLLGVNVGHLQGTARVGEVGNVVLSGHVELRDGHKGVFSLLNQAVVGDRVIVVDGDVQTQYVITEVYTTTPDDLTPVYPSIEPRLTLITCGSYDFFSNQYLERTIVVAVPIG